MYEEYRQFDMDDIENRDRLWAQIDSVSGEAAKFAIANEYDKMVSNIGLKEPMHTPLPKQLFMSMIYHQSIKKMVRHRV